MIIRARFGDGQKSLSTSRLGWLGFFALVLVFLPFAATQASAETRSLKLYNLHTREKAEIVFKRNGRYDQEGLRKINHFMRDWRRNEPTKMDPRLLDLAWEVYRATGASQPINVICGYRAPATNSMLRGRSRSSGVAKNSQHTLGKALDFFIPGVSLKKLRETAMKMQVGGVGYYPRSGSPFVHIDVGNVRMWPRMSRQELARVFPNGKTLYLPSDGKPLPGYEAALASYNARKKSGETAIAMASASSSSRSSGGLLSALFGGGADEEEDIADADDAPAPKAPAARRAPGPAPVAKPAVAVAKADLPGVPDSSIRIVAPDKADRADIPAAAPAVVEKPAVIAALPARNAPVPVFAPRPKAEVPAADVPFGRASEEVAVASAAPAATPQPASVPFGMATVVPDDQPAMPAEGAAAPAQVALAVAKVPMPTWRPSLPADRTTDTGQASFSKQVAAADEADRAVLLALAEQNDARPGAFDGIAPLPQERPHDAVERSMTVSALPAPRPDQALLSGSHGQKLAAVIPASPKVALSNRTAGTSVAEALDSGVRTTDKAGRVSATDRQPGRRSIVISAQPSDMRWAFAGPAVVARSTREPSGPAIAYNFVRTAPREVLATGFQPDNRQPAANRFTGKAVEFIPVARFD